MSKRIAVMDLGTNTFHLLIAEGFIQNFTTLVHEHIGVKLGEGGINKGYILQEAYDRGLSTMQNFKQLIDQYNVTETRAIATSALRNADNGLQFINEVKEKTGISIEIIDGQREAELIYKGIKAAGCLADGNSLIMDIGGGSVEFILGNAGGILWKHSFEVGAARLMDKFHQVDPIPNKAIYELDRYLDTQLALLMEAVKDKPIEKLIGSSGSFETFAEVIEAEKGTPIDIGQITRHDFKYDELTYLIEELVASSHYQRAKNSAINPIRVDMIVVASLITRFVIRKLNIQHVEMSTYSLKEGVLAEQMMD